MRFVLFLAVFIAIYFGMHAYVYLRIAGGLGVTGPAALWLRSFFYLAGFSFLAAEFAVRRAPGWWTAPLTWAGTVWLGTLTIALAVFILRDLAALVVHAPGFRFYSTAAAVALTVLLSAFSVYNVSTTRMQKTFTVPVKRLPPALDGFRIVQISDLHVNFASSPRWLEGIVRDVNVQDPDLVVITGDLIDADICGATGKDFCGILRGIRSKHGVYAIPGNHEYYTGMDVFMRNLRETGITPLRNGRATVAGGIELVGIDDDITYLRDRAEPYIRKAMDTPGPADPAKPVVLLAHRPDVFDAAARLGVDLQLSGHTHVGQIPPLDLIVMTLAFKYPYGLYRNGEAVLYTTAGTGWWGPPMRLTSRCEIATFILKSR